jgi:hypothetical protein
MPEWWKRFSAAFFGGFAGKVAAAIVMAGLLAVGLGGPTTWFERLAINQEMLRWILVGLALGVGFIWFWRLPWIARRIPIAVSRIGSRGWGYAQFAEKNEDDARNMNFGDNTSLVTITNRSTTKNVTLDIRLHVTLKKQNIRTSF